jgi:hypothetical protein
VGVAVRGLPAGQPLRVRGARMPEGSPDRGRWHSIWVEADERPAAQMEDVAYVLVDEARLAFADPDALTAWRTGDPVDGLADLAFWGRDAHILSVRTGAGALDDGTCGWTGLPVRDAAQLARDLYRAKESEGRRFALDLRPHDDHHRLLSLARAAPTESASVEIGGCLVCGFFTSWGDGAFPVRRDLTADGTLCRRRVEVGTPEIAGRQRKLEDHGSGSCPGSPSSAGRWLTAERRTAGCTARCPATPTTAAGGSSRATSPPTNSTTRRTSQSYRCATWSRRTRPSNRSSGHQRHPPSNADRTDGLSLPSPRRPRD